MAPLTLSPIFRRKIQTLMQMQTYHTCSKQTPLLGLSLSIIYISTANMNNEIKTEIPCQTWHFKTVASPSEAVMASLDPLIHSHSVVQIAGWKKIPLPISLNKGWMNKHCHYWMKRNFFLSGMSLRKNSLLSMILSSAELLFPLPSLTAAFFISKRLCYSCCRRIAQSTIMCFASLTDV